MKIFKILVISLAVCVILVFTGMYGFFLFGLPKLLSSPEYINKYQTFIKEKTNFDTTINNFNLKTKPNLGIEIYLKHLDLNSDKKEQLANIKNLSYNTNLLNLKHGALKTEYIFVDLDKIKNNIPKNENETPINFNFSYYPQINIKKVDIVLTPNNTVEINGINSQKKHGKVITKLRAKVISKYLQKPLLAGEQGSIIYSKKGLEFDNFSAQLANANLNISGDLQNLHLEGKNLPIKELENSFLYFYKLKNPNKRNFIENFTNFKGIMDISLDYKKDGIFGKCITHNLGADFSNFKIPLFFPKTVFFFEGKSIKADTSGLFGQDPVNTDFSLTGLMTKDLIIKGNVYSKLTDKTTKKYYPAIKIVGNADAKVNYTTQNGKVDVNYTLTINKGNNLESSYGNLDNTDKIRKVSMHTIKNGTPMSIESYDYSIYNGKEYEKLLLGNGKFDKVNGHYKLSYLTLKSNGRVSVNYIKSFLRDYVKDGTFDANLRYDFSPKTLLGAMNFYDISHSNFLYLKNTRVNIEKNKLYLDMNGSFYGSPLQAKATADNDFRKTFYVYDIDVHLDSFYVQKGKLTSIPKTFKTDKSAPKINKTKDIDVVVEKGNIKVDRIYSRKFDVRNVVLVSNLKNNVANFVMPQAEYAGGLLSAKGTYNIKRHSSDIEFFASDIDSNEVATNFFRLKDQVEGSAFATLHVITKNKLNDIKAKATFAIADGFLPKIGSQEFIINSSKKERKIYNSKIANKLREKFKDIKISLSKITNIDFSKPNMFYSNLYGSFNIHNEDVKDVKLFSKSDFLSMFIEGEYNIDSERGDLSVWGRRNKTEAKKIRIFKIPLNLIYRIVFRPEHTKEQYQDKINLIPEIKSKIGDDIALFRVSVSGELNSENDNNKLKIILKDLR